MANILDFGGVRVLTSNAQPGAGYVAKFFVSGTTTPVIVYTDSTLGTAHGTSVTCDAAGIPPAVWSSGGAVKCVIEDANGAVVQTIDPVISVAGGGSDAEDITFTPTVELPFTNVQDAIEGAAASAASGYAAFGIGITGNATLLADIDATNIGAGVYRFDNTTAGTYPTGVAAVDTGLVEHWRQAGATAMQFLYHATTDRIFHRRMASTTWGTWRENITTNQGATRGDTIRRGASAWERLTLPVNGQFLRSDGTDVVAASGGYTWLAEQSTASGSTKDWTGIPSWATEVCLMLYRVTSSAGLDVRPMVAGAAVATGLLGTSGTLDGANQGVDGDNTAWPLWGSTTSYGTTGEMTFKKFPGSNRWVQSHAMARAAVSDGSIHGGGYADLAGALDGVRLLGTFTGGSAIVGYR